MVKKVYIVLLIFFTNWLFSQNEPYITITVSKDGTGHFSSIQKAINSIRDFGPANALITIKEGTYHEKITIPSSKHKIILKGENKEKTIITHDDYSGKLINDDEKINTFTSYTLKVLGDDIQITDITIQNSSCNQGQAVALHVEGDRFKITNSKISGCQDTIFTGGNHSRQFFKNCDIEGTTDFIFGAATVIFKDCNIKSLSNSYITAASTNQNKSFGYVFLDCKLVAKEGVHKVYLGRPWRPYAKTVFINTEMGNHILPEGWNPWKHDKMFPDKEKTAYYAEFNSKGEGGKTQNRVSWSHQLSKKEAKKYTIKTIFKDWNPENQ